jgi:ubiquinone/menaquinone biosynthesis C-methylase UbiE
MPANYDNSAWFYDSLARVVFGNSLVKAQTHFLHLIPANANVLIAGGGTGWIIEEISKIHPVGLHITYVEISARMMALAKKHTTNNVVTYVNAPVENAGLLADFDVMITPFLLDSLSPDIFNKVFDNLYDLLKPGGLWLNTDFQLTGKWWQKPLLNTMYFFFRTVGCVDSSILPDLKKAFANKEMKLFDEALFYGNFVAAGVYKK